MFSAALRVDSAIRWSVEQGSLDRLDIDDLASIAKLPIGLSSLPLALSQHFSDVVSRQYEQWVYPEPIHDIPAWLADNWQWFDPSHAQRILWPNRDCRSDLDVLIAGCGANQAAVFAYANPGSRIVGIDVSEASLAHQLFLKQKYDLVNLELYRLPIEEVGSLGRDFDLIVSTGVLHHLADPADGMKALAGCLRVDGVAAIMLYARYGRTGVELMQAIFREIGLKQTAADLFTVKEAVALLPDAHPLRSYLSCAPDLHFDAGLVDTFLHGRDRSFAVTDCLDLVESAGMAFQGWFFKSPYEPPLPPGGGFYAAVTALSDRKRWGVMERINTANACHFFLACHADKPHSDYSVDLASVDGLDAVPHFRYRCGVEGNEVYRPGWRQSLNDHNRDLARLVDGCRSIRQIIAQITASEGLSGSAAEEQIHDSRMFFQSLVNRDFITLGIQS